MKKPFGAKELDTLNKLNEAANIVYSLPKDDPNRAEMIAAVQEAFGEYMQQVDLPAEALAPEAPLVAILDWAPGIARTLVGETAKSIKDVAQGNAPSGSLANVGKAIASPYYGPAQSTGTYLEELGFPKGPTLAESALGQRMGIEKGSTFDISPRGVVGFAGDVYSGKAWNPVGKAVNKFTGAGKEKDFLSSVEKTAVEQRRKQQEFLDAMRARTSGGPKELAMGAVKYSGKIAKDGPMAVGRDIYGSRFSDLDQANIEAGKLPVSPIMREHGGWGGSEKQIVQDMRGVLDAKNKAMDALIKDNAIHPVRASELFEKFYKDADVQRALNNPATSEAAKEAIKEVEGMFVSAIENNPNTIPAYRSTDPTMRRAHEIMGGPVSAFEQRVPGVGAFSKSDVKIDPQYERGFTDMFGEPKRPTLEENVLNAIDPQYTGQQLHDLKKSFQNEAFNRGAYQARDIANPSDVAKNDMARLAMTKMGHYSGEALENALETPIREFNLQEAVPTNALKAPIGAQYASLNQDIASILQAAPNVASSGVSGANIPLTNISIGDLLNASRIPVGRTLMSPPMQYAPSVGRAMLLNRNERIKRESPYYRLRNLK